MKVASLLPSACELVVLAGGEEMLVGRSHEDDFPSSVKRLPILTGQVIKFESSKQVRWAALGAI